MDAQLGQVFRTSSLQGIQRLDHFQCVSRGVSKWRIHIGDERCCPAACLFPDADHRLRQRNRVLFGLHKGAASSFDIQQDCVRSGSDLLTHNARCNQR